jgi:hypothetical protein
VLFFASLLAALAAVAFLREAILVLGPLALGAGAHWWFRHQEADLILRETAAVLAVPSWETAGVSRAA